MAQRLLVWAYSCRGGGGRSIGGLIRVVEVSAASDGERASGLPHPSRCDTRLLFSSCASRHNLHNMAGP
jgi:hypothetical protein